MRGRGKGRGNKKGEELRGGLEGGEGFVLPARNRATGKARSSQVSVPRRKIPVAFKVVSRIF